MTAKFRRPWPFLTFSSFTLDITDVFTAAQNKLISQQ